MDMYCSNMKCRRKYKCLRHISELQYEWQKVEAKGEWMDFYSGHTDGSGDCGFFIRRKSWLESILGR